MKDTDKLEDLANEVRDYLVFDLFADGVAATMKGMFSDVRAGDTTGAKELAMCLRNIADTFENDPSNLGKYIDVARVLCALSLTKVKMQENTHQ